jgi:hypothetical protein
MYGSADKDDQPTSTDVTTLRHVASQAASGWKGAEEAPTASSGEAGPLYQCSATRFQVQLRVSESCPVPARVAEPSSQPPPPDAPFFGCYECVGLAVCIECHRRPPHLDRALPPPFPRCELHSRLSSLCLLFAVLCWVAEACALRRANSRATCDQPNKQIPWRRTRHREQRLNLCCCTNG